MNPFEFHPKVERVAWLLGVYDCCGSKTTCANNRTKKAVDEFIALVKKDENEARCHLWDWIANLEESLEWAQFKYSELEEKIKEKLKVGDRVEKTGGDYIFPGVIVAVFPKLSGKTRVVVEDNRGILHIFSENNLTKITDRNCQCGHGYLIAHNSGDGTDHCKIKGCPCPKFKV